jgi:hypothetical protein
VLTQAIADHNCPDIDGAQKIISLLDSEIEEYEEQLRLETLGIAVVSEFIPQHQLLYADGDCSLTA